MSDSRSSDRRKAKAELRQRRSAARRVVVQDGSEQSSPATRERGGEPEAASAPPAPSTPPAPPTPAPSPEDTAPPAATREATPEATREAPPDARPDATPDATPDGTAGRAAADSQSDPAETPRRVIVIEDEQRPEAAGLNRLDEQQRPRRPWRPTLDGTSPSRMRLLLVVLVVAVAIVAGLLGWRALAADQVEDARTGATAAGRTAVVDVLSYDHNRLDSDFKAASDGLTPSFRKEYEKTTKDVVGPTAKQYKAVVKASVVESSVVQAEADRVVLLMFVNQQTTSTRLDGPRADLARLRVTLVDADGWQVDDLDAL